ncbi:putative splicing factor 3A subunit 1 isoform B, partial [Balamuthia mandrillaris]
MVIAEASEYLTTILRCSTILFTLVLVLQRAIAESKLQKKRKSNAPLPERPKATTDECGLCGARTGDIGTTLLACGRCRKAAYCSKACQVAHWPSHKP